MTYKASNEARGIQSVEDSRDRKVLRRVIVGTGYLTGDGECFCIHPTSSAPKDADKMALYPREFFHKDSPANPTKHKRNKKVRYQITTEVELLE